MAEAYHLAWLSVVKRYAGNCSEILLYFSFAGVQLGGVDRPTSAVASCSFHAGHDLGVSALLFHQICPSIFSKNKVT